MLQSEKLILKQNLSVKRGVNIMFHSKQKQGIHSDEAKIEGEEWFQGMGREWRH